MSFSNSKKFSFFFCFEFCVIEWFYNMGNTKHQKKAAVEKTGIEMQQEMFFC